MDIPPQILWLLIGLILVGMILVSLKIHFTSLSKSTDKIIGNQEEILDDYAEYDLTKWDNQEITGDYVRNYIRENLGDYTTSETAPIYVTVKSVVSSTNYTNTYTNKTHIKDISNFSQTQYFIHPRAVFFCEVIRSENKVILGINFTQK